MDYRALAELVMMSLLGLSTLVFAVGLSVRLFLAPTLRELFGAKKDGPELFERQLAELDDRLDSIEGSLDRLLAAKDFDRELDDSLPRLVTDGE